MPEPSIRRATVAIVVAAAVLGGMSAVRIRTVQEVIGGAQVIWTGDEVFVVVDRIVHGWNQTLPGVVKSLALGALTAHGPTPDDRRIVSSYWHLTRRGLAAGTLEGHFVAQHFSWCEGRGLTIFHRDWRAVWSPERRRFEAFPDAEWPGDRCLERIDERGYSAHRLYPFSGGQARRSLLVAGVGLIEVELKDELASRLTRERVAVRILGTGLPETPHLVVDSRVRWVGARAYETAFGAATSDPGRAEKTFGQLYEELQEYRAAIDVMVSSR